MPDRELTPKQKMFVQEYLIDLNATQAAIRAGYSEKTANEIGTQNLAKLSIQEKIQEAIKKREKKVEITAERVLNEIARIAFFDPRRLFDDEGRPLHITELDDDTAAVIAGLDVTELSGNDKTTARIKKYKVADKLGALQSLAKHLGLATEHLNITGAEIVIQ